LNAGMTLHDVNFMIGVFTQCSDYQFKVKLPLGYNLPNTPNIDITDEFIEQQQILCK